MSDRGVLDFINRRIDAMQAFGDAYPAEAERIDLVNNIFGLQNSQKAYMGQLKGLADPVILTKRRRAQEELQDSLQQPERAAEFGGLIARLAELQESKRAQAPAYASFLALTNDSYEASTLARAMLAFQVMNVTRGGNADAGAGLRSRFRDIEDKPAELDIALMAARFQEWADHYGEFHPLGTEHPARAHAGSSGACDLQALRAG